MQSVPAQLQFARELHERIRREFPELRIYTFWEKPVGESHPLNLPLLRAPTSASTQANTRS